MKRPVLLGVLLVVVAGTLWIQRKAGDLASGVDEALRATQTSGLEKRRQELWSSKKYDETGFERMGPPREGEWLARFVEQGQTADEYRVECRNRRSPAREAIALRPFGPLSARARAALEPLRRFTQAFFTLNVRLLDERPLPEKAFQRDRVQYDVTPLLEDLKGEVAPGELMHAGVLDKDLCWLGVTPNFVFGGAGLTGRVGVYSLTRLAWGQVPEPLYRRRAFGLVAHELGHILGMAHCVYYKCLMNGSNSQVESDATPCHLCPVCLDKLEWNVGCARQDRYRELARVFRDEGILDEARWAEERAR